MTHDAAGRLRLRLDHEALECSPSGSVAGPIWVESTDGSAFPEVGWWDRPAVALADWLSGRPMLFMEGRFEIVLTGTVARFLRNGHEVRRNDDGDLDQLWSSCRSAARRVVRVSDARRWPSDDIEGLRAFVSS